MNKKPLSILCVSLCLTTLFSFDRLSDVEVMAEIHTEYSIAKDSTHTTTHPILFADKVEVGRKLASEKKTRDVMIDEALEKEQLEFPAIDLYGEASWNDKVNPISGTSVEIPSNYDIDLSGFVMPVDGHYVTSKFGYRRRFGRMHFGIDLDLNTGDPVKSTFDGRVRVVDYDPPGYGHYIIVRHPNGLETVYGHLSKTSVQVGDIVRAGDIIGLGGSTGHSTGSHLHYETRFMGIAINPEALINFSSGEPKFNSFAFHRETISSARGSSTKFSSSGFSSRFLSKTTKKGSSSTSSITIHRIKKGENLSTIANKYGISVSKIKKLNGLRSNSIVAGNTLRIK